MASRLYKKTAEAIYTLDKTTQKHKMLTRELDKRDKRQVQRRGVKC